MAATFAIFVLFFGVALLDALVGGHWYRAVFFALIGVAFLVMSRPRPAKRPET